MDRNECIAITSRPQLAQGPQAAFPHTTPAQPRQGPETNEPRELGRTPPEVLHLERGLDMPTSALARNSNNTTLPPRDPLTSGWIDGVLASSTLSGSAKLFGLALVNHGERTGGETPTAERLMALCGFRSIDRLIAARKLLEARGFIRVERRSGKILRYVLAEVAV